MATVIDVSTLDGLVPELIRIDFEEDEGIPVWPAEFAGGSSVDLCFPGVFAELPGSEFYSPKSKSRTKETWEEGARKILQGVQ